MHWKLALLGLMMVAACSALPDSSPSATSSTTEPATAEPVPQPGDLDVSEGPVVGHGSALPSVSPDDYTIVTGADGVHRVDFSGSHQVELPAGVCLRTADDWNEVERRIGDLLGGLFDSYGGRISGWPTTTIAAPDQPGLEVVDPEVLVMMSLALRTEVAGDVLAAIERWEEPYGGQDWPPPRLLSDAARGWGEAAMPLVTDILALCGG